MTIYTIIYLVKSTIWRCESFSDFHKAKKSLAKLLKDIYEQAAFESDAENLVKWDDLDVYLDDYVENVPTTFLFNRGELKVDFWKVDLD